MNLDINTPKGQKSLVHEREAHDIIKRRMSYQVVETPKSTIAVGDGFLIKDGEVFAFFETKCRYDMTYEQLLDRGSWLITYEKILKCQEVSKLLQVPFYGFLYLLPKREPTQKLLLYSEITNDHGEFMFEIKHFEEPTQKTINGGNAIRDNGHIPVNQLKVV
jgi:hypothetical protein